MTQEDKEFIEGFALNGDEVKEAEDKTFEITEKPTYSEFTDLENGKVKRRLKMLVLFNGSVVEYYPNKTSQSKIVQKVGRDLTKWEGFKGEFETTPQKVGKDMKNVIYIK